MQAPPELPSSLWSRADRVALVGLIVLLVLLFVARVQTRRIDSSRTPRTPDLLVLHVEGLRADAAPTEALASDLGFDTAELLVFEQTFAQSSDGRRSALSALSGDLALNLEAPLTSVSLPSTLRSEGWSTYLIAPPSLVETAGPAFDLASSPDDALRADTLAGIADAEDRPVFAFVHLAAGAPLHSSTTDARELHTRYRGRVTELRGLIAQLSQAFARRDRPQLVVLLGASGAELGEHPDAPDRLHDTALRVPWIMGLRHGRGLPHGVHATLVQSADLAPTLLDFVDARPLSLRDQDGIVRDGVSLEPLVHGWEIPPVHERLFFAGPGEVAVRSEGWKLAARVDAPWTLRRFDARLHALAEDPGERTDLAEGRDLGPVGEELIDALEARLARPESVATR